MKSKSKIVSSQYLAKQIPQWRKKGKTIAFTNGCFDLLHAGHVQYLTQAKRNNRILIIGLNSDSSIRMIKGPQRPIVPQKERAEVLAGLESVDYVTIFNESTPEQLLAKLKPDVLIKGADWKGRDVAGAKEIKKRGGRVEFIKYRPHCSTTEIIKKIQNQCAA